MANKMAVTENKPPLFEDVLLYSDDGKSHLGYYAGKRHGADEFCDSATDGEIKNITHWTPVFPSEEDG